ncbi:hypothetical protein BDZ89DRAFT_1078688 [Hymenopellis radicata]|nr:hypothetical protein BDZ89DRAFT_1078688 [Hymenopellis radicata]
MEINPQLASPLFASIPPEIRNYIFRLALRSSYDLKQPYSGHTYYYRPGFRYAQTISTVLLRTCKLIYSETRLLPWLMKLHVFWCHRGPPNTPHCAPEQYFDALLSRQRESVGCVQIFAQLWWLEGDFPKLCACPSIHMRSLKITVRNSDWWYWERNQMLALKDEWTRNIGKIRGLEDMQLELEVVQRDYEQLMAIVRRVLTWRIKLYDGRLLTTEGNPLKEKHWLGTSHPEPASGLTFDNVAQKWGVRRVPHRANTAIYPAAPVMYVVVTVSWTPVALKQS